MSYTSYSDCNEKARIISYVNDYTLYLKKFLAANSPLNLLRYELDDDGLMASLQSFYAGLNASILNTFNHQAMANWFQSQRLDNFNVSVSTVMPGRLGIWQETNAGVNIETYFSQIRNYFGQSVHDQLVSMFLNASTYYVDSLNANEWHIYGSSRLGVYQRQINMAWIRFQAGVSSGQFQSPSDSTFNYAEADFSFYPIYRGYKNYELSNHLGNVLAVISDMKLYTCHQYNKFEDFENTPNINGDWNIRDSWEGQNAVINLSNGKLHIVDSITSNPHVRVNYLLPKHLPPNQTYRIKFDLEHINGDHDWQIGIVSSNTDSTYEANFTFFSGSSGHNEITFQPTGHVWRIRFLHIPTAQDMEFNFDNFSLENLSIDSNLVSMADVLSATDYSPFGAPLAGRTYQSSEYRFSFNGMEKIDEINGAGNDLDFGARIYDARLGRWLSLDPLQAKYPSLSPYNYVANTPIIAVDRDGRDFEIIIDKVNKTITISTTYYTDSEISSERMCAAANSIMNENGKFSFETEDGENYKINFNVNVVFDPNKDASATAVDDLFGNSLTVLDEKTYEAANPENGLISNGITKYGGDKTEVREENSDNQDEVNVATHETLHGLGVDHSAMGLRGYNISKSVIKSILHFASKSDKGKISVKGGKDSRTLISEEKTGEYRRPNSRITTTDGSNVTLKGKVKRSKL